MKHRIRAAALIEISQRLLLVEHQDKNGNKWWVPPGGGLEDKDASVLDCVAREVREETGLSVEVGPLLYVKEFIDTTNDTRHLELFFEAKPVSGYASGLPDVASTVVDAAVLGSEWICRAEMESLAVFPENLKNEYWEDRGLGITRYLGVSMESKDRKK
jgi:8-oxo-dGTP diphosphatase